MTEKTKMPPSALTLDWNNVSSYDYSDSDHQSPRSVVRHDNVLHMQYSPDILNEETEESQKSEQ